MLIAITIAVVIVDALLGSVPWGLVISKYVFGQDVREHGSGNIGTTNMMRTYGKKAGIIVFLLDFFKGVLAGVIAWAAAQAMIGNGILTEEAVASFPALGMTHVQAYCGFMLALSFFGSVWGHIFSPWLHFKGGKGIATSVGNEFVMLGAPLAVLELVIFGVLVVITRYVSIGSIVAAFACLPLSLYVYWGNPVAIAFCWITALTVVWAHRANMKRLAAGTENRIGSKKDKQEEK